MSQNYNLNSTFGYNVSTKGLNFKSGASSAKAKLNSAIGDIFDSITSFVSKNEKVFNGNIEHQINLYSRQTMLVGMNLKAAEPKRNLDISI